MRHPIRGAFAAALALTMIAASAMAAEHLNVGYTGGLCEGPLHIAIENGYFAEEGLEVEAIRLAPGTNFEAIAAGKIDASFGLLATLIQPLANGLPVKITIGLHTGCDKILVPKGSSIREFADFKDKRVGVPSLSSSPIMFAKRVLAANGVGVGDRRQEVEFVVFANAELPLALSRGAIDAIAANDPVASVAAKEYELTVLADSALTPPYDKQYCCAAYVSAILAETRPETAAKFTRAMGKASAWIQEHPEETTHIQVERKYVAGDPEFNASILKTYNYIPSVQGAYDAFAITARELQEIGVLADDVDVDALLEFSFAQLPL